MISRIERELCWLLVLITQSCLWNAVSIDLPFTRGVPPFPCCCYLAWLSQARPKIQDPERIGQSTAVVLGQFDIPDSTRLIVKT